NVAEWCQDDYEETGYAYAHDLNPVYYDPRIKASDRVPGGGRVSDSTAISIRKVHRGGSWKDIGYFLSNGTRSYEFADTAKSFIGFRCVMTVIGRSGAAGQF
ncbi:MAG: SUMF1/EgtB/PvdO family nonheme iron enzyme, partial [Bacteroidetes bacterium]|nr:SUMF1/EgtB/PvdO family nonheme iron enzyme [Bacteroidota bacterium]